MIVDRQHCARRNGEHGTLEIFRLLGQGRTTSQIASDLNLSLKTVQAYCARAKEKFGVSSLTELLRAAFRWEDASHVK